MLSIKKKEQNKIIDQFKIDDPNVSLYNLPLKVEFCKTCLMSNQKPCQTAEHRSNEIDKKVTIEFKDGICHACYYKKQKKENGSLRQKKRKWIYKKTFQVFKR